MKKRILFLLLGVFISFGCSESSSEKEAKSKPVVKKEEPRQTQRLPFACLKLDLC